MTLGGYGVPGADRRRRGGDGNSSSTRDTEGSTATYQGDEMESDMELAAVPTTPWGTTEGESGGITMVRMQRHSDGSGSTRPEHGALTRSEYGLLAPEGPAGNPSVAGPQENGDNPEVTTGTGGTGGRETRME